MLLVLKQAIEKHGIKDSIVAVEMTGTYHQIIFRALRDAKYETRIVHPFASSHYRAPEHGDVKTDDNDLIAIFRAAVNGFGLLEQPWDDVHRSLQLLVRHRRDLVNKRAKLQCQIRHHLERSLPGYANCFPDDSLWTQPGDGGNKRLKGKDETGFRYSILQILPHDMLKDDVQRIEASWKFRLHTREFGLNAN